jgi:hypothetical protein
MRLQHRLRLRLFSLLRRLRHKGLLKRATVWRTVATSTNIEYSVQTQPWKNVWRSEDEYLHDEFFLLRIMGATYMEEGGPSFHHGRK